MDDEATFAAAFGLQPGALVALVGGGGKSSVILALARGWPGRAVVTTTTRLWRAQTELAPVCLRSAEPEQVAAALGRHRWCMVVGPPDGDKVRGVAPDAARRWLAGSADLVLVEADGSRGLPVKSPAPHEPVLPDGVTTVIVVAGLDALEQPIAVVAHRPERVAALVGADLDHTLTPAQLATILTHAAGGLKDAPPDARVVIVLNKADTASRRSAAATCAALAITHPHVERVLITSTLPVPQIHACSRDIHIARRRPTPRPQLRQPSDLPPSAA